MLFFCIFFPTDQQKTISWSHWKPQYFLLGLRSLLLFPFCHKGWSIFQRCMGYAILSLKGFSSIIQESSIVKSSSFHQNETKMKAGCILHSSPKMDYPDNEYCGTFNFDLFLIPGSKVIIIRSLTTLYKDQDQTRLSCSGSEFTEKNYLQKTCKKFTFLTLSELFQTLL